MTICVPDVCEENVYVIRKKILDLGQTRITKNYQRKEDDTV